MWGGNLELTGDSARSSQLPASSACSLPTPGAPSWAAGARLLPRVTQRFPCYRAFAHPSASPGTPWPISRMLRGSDTHPTGPAPCWKHELPRSSTPPACLIPCWTKELGGLRGLWVRNGEHGDATGLAWPGWLLLQHGHPVSWSCLVLPESPRLPNTTTAPLPVASESFPALREGTWLLQFWCSRRAEMGGSSLRRSGGICQTPAVTASSTSCRRRGSRGRQLTGLIHPPPAPLPTPRPLGRSQQGHKGA